MTKSMVVCPVLSKEFASRGQIDLVDMQSMPRENNKRIIVHQDHLTKFCVLPPMKSERPTEIAAQLVDIFLLLSSPAVLQSDNGTEFTVHFISVFRPALVMVHGKARHPQSQGSVERTNGDIKDTLVAWLADTDMHDWVTGIKFVQFQKNSAYHSGIKRSPYSVLLGEEARVALTTSFLPQEVLSKLDSVEDLLAVIMDQPSTSVYTSRTTACVMGQCNSLCDGPMQQPMDRHQ